MMSEKYLYVVKGCGFTCSLTKLEEWKEPPQDLVIIEDQFQRGLDRASRIVSEWPEWKRKALEGLNANKS